MAYTTDTGRVATGVATGPITALRRAIANALAAYRDYVELSRAEAQLNSLTDRELADVGLHRSQIHQAVWDR